MSGLRYLKWDSHTIGTISEDWNVTFTDPRYNVVTAFYTQSAAEWPSPQFRCFLEDRMVSKDRRDIEKILFRLGLSVYDVFRIAEVTRAIHPKDLLWIANAPDEPFEAVITRVFDSVVRQKSGLSGDSVDSPEGGNFERSGVFNSRYGIYKQRLHPLSTDAESETAVYLLSQKLGVPCCPVCFTGRDTVFSTFLYDFSQEYLVHFRHLFNGPRSDNEYHNLISIRSQYKKEIIQMLLLDFITRQDDRHLSNMAVKIDGNTESFYPLYDNGRSLFYEDTEETVRKAARDIKTYSTSFGPSGTYWDHISAIAGHGDRFTGVINLRINKDEIAALLKEARFSGYRFDGALEWINAAIAVIKELG
jgi:hypothetical protein